MSKRMEHLEKLVDAVVVGMSDDDDESDELFEAFINRPHSFVLGRNICGDDFERESVSRMGELERALTDCLDGKGKELLSEHVDVVDRYWMTVARSNFDLGVKLGRILERQRATERMLANLEKKKTMT